MASKREALNTCGRLKKGYRFRKGGAIVKGKRKGKAPARRRGQQGALF